MAEEADLVDAMDDVNLLEKRALLTTRKEKARKELMKVSGYIKLRSTMLIDIGDVIYKCFTKYYIMDCLIFIRK